LVAGSPEAAGRQIFVSRCASCHGTNAMGGEFAPSIIERVPLRTDDDLVRLLHSGLLTSGMPAFPDIVDKDRTNLISYLRTLKPFWGTAIVRTSVKLEGGQALDGARLNRSGTDLQILGDDHKLYLLRKKTSDEYRVVTSQVDWPSYNGQTIGSRLRE
jgi:alcohol dehydrogenase (cytochrome c)